MGRAEKILRRGMALYGLWGSKQDGKSIQGREGLRMCGQPSMGCQSSHRVRGMFIWGKGSAWDVGVQPSPVRRCPCWMAHCGMWEPREGEERVHKESGLEWDVSPCWVRGGRAQDRLAAVMGEWLCRGRRVDQISTYSKDNAGQVSHHQRREVQICVREKTPGNPVVLDWD